MPHLDISLRTEWSEVHEVRKRVEALLSDVPEDIRSAASMVAAELVENAVKYGRPLGDASSSVMTLDSDGDCITMVVRNGLESEELLKDLVAHVDRITGADDRAALYLSRLRELMVAPSGGSSRLGLYRIAAEGGFSLACEHRDGVVSVIATRRMTPRERHD